MRNKKYKHKKSGGIYTLKAYATCKDRDIPVVVYSDSEGNIYTRTRKDFFNKFVELGKENNGNATNNI